MNFLRHDLRSAAAMTLVRCRATAVICVTVAVGACSSHSPVPTQAPALTPSSMTRPSALPDPNSPFGCRVDAGTAGPTDPKVHNAMNAMSTYLRSHQDPPTVVPGSRPPSSTVNLSAISAAFVSPQGTTIVDCGVIATQAGNDHLGQKLQAPFRSVTMNDTYEIGSETKIFTGLALALMNGNQVHLTDPLPADFANLPINCDFGGTGMKPITLEMLATHNSGLRDLPPNKTWNPDNPGGRSSYSLQDMYNSFSSRAGGSCNDLFFAPGTDYSYSDWGYAILGAILAGKSETQQYGALVSNLITTPLGMRDTHLENPRGQSPTPQSTAPPSALPVSVIPTCSPTMVADSTAECFFNNNNAFAGAGGLVSTISDMAAFVRAELGVGSTGSVSSTAIQQTHQALGYGMPCRSQVPPFQCTAASEGLAWGITPKTLEGAPNSSSATLVKNGATNGFASITFLQPEVCWGATFLTNASSAAAVNYATGFTKEVLAAVEPTDGSLCHP